MVLNFEEGGYVDVDRVVAMRYKPEAEKGFVIFEGERIVVDKDQYEVIEKAYRKQHYTHLYDENGTKVGGM